MKHEAETDHGPIEDANITLSDGEFHACVVVDPAQLQECFRLRYGYFVAERGWVAPEHCPHNLECDAYDTRALHLAVFRGEVAVAYLRILAHEPGREFMLDREFCALLPEEKCQSLVREGAAELSRLVCRSDFFKAADSQTHPVEWLFKLFYRVCQERDFSRFYIVVEEAWLRLFARRFGWSFHAIGQPHVFPDGTRTVAAMATLEELEGAIQRYDPAKWAWYEDKG